MDAEIKAQSDKGDKNGKEWERPSEMPVNVQTASLEGGKKC
jgi:hypothetical protein